MTTKTTYKPIGKYIYFDGHSYRTRVRVNGITISFSHGNRETSLRVRNKLLKLRE